MAKLYERVMLVRPVHLDFTGEIMKPGAEATIVDLLDDDVVLLEFHLDSPEVASTTASVHDFVTVSS